jgi:hypothetical protein
MLFPLLITLSLIDTNVSSMRFEMLPMLRHLSFTSCHLPQDLMVNSKQFNSMVATRLKLSQFIACYLNFLFDNVFVLSWT